MKIKLSDFPHQPGTMGCCTECKGATKDCIPDPTGCADFLIHNLEFIEQTQLENSLATQVNAITEGSTKC